MKPAPLSLRIPALALGLAAALPVLAAPGRASAGLDLAGMDRAVAPGDDFFAFANGAWTRATEIPADRSAYSIGAMLVDVTDRRTADLIRAEAAHPSPAGSEAWKIGVTFTTAMDEAAIEALGIRPLQPALDRIAAIHDRAGLARVLGRTVRADVDALNATSLHTENVLGLWVAQDLDDPSRYAPFLLQGGLGLPDREYYLDASPRMAGLQAQYRAHILAVLKLLKVEGAEARAQGIFELERALAQGHASQEDTEQVTLGNNHWTRKDFHTKAPGMDWEEFFQSAGLGAADSFVVWQPSAVTALAALASGHSLEVWKDYLVFRAAEHASAVLPRAFVEEHFAFHGKALMGVPQIQERWKRAIQATHEALGEAVGKLYVKRYFPPAEKARAQAMVKDLLAAFAKRIDALDWMAPETKARAKAKLAVLKVGVGYPDRWRDYSALEVVPGDAFGNAERAEFFELRRNLAKLGRKVDRDEWVMTPQTVNAVNLPAMNAMNFPAAILQPPFFDPARTGAMNFGATGATIGHEISHSFDDQGALFDAEGRLRNWWTKEDLAHFQASAAQLAKQFDGYRPFPDLAVNGKQTLGENIADLAGLCAAYDAFRISLRGKEAPKVQGFTGDQQFFLSYAQSWRTKMREPALRRQVLTNGHAPGQYRTCTVRNLDAWYEAFAVKLGQTLALAPKDRIRIW